jgi:hypothetical protein
MPVTTGEIVLIVALFIFLAIAIFWFVVANNYGKYANGWSYTRGANIDLGVGATTSSSASVPITCGDGHEICVWRATAVCSGGGGGATNSETSKYDPIDISASNYNGYNPLTTIDLTADMSKAVNGKQNNTYTFEASSTSAPGDGVNGVQWPTQGMICPPPATEGSTARPQLIATYTCIPTGSKCNGYLLQQGTYYWDATSQSWLGSFTLFNNNPYAVYYLAPGSKTPSTGQNGAPAEIVAMGGNPGQTFLPVNPPPVPGGVLNGQGGVTAKTYTLTAAGFSTLTIDAHGNITAT